MSDELFTAPQTTDPLHLARLRYGNAVETHRQAEEWADDTGEAVPREAVWELQNAHRALMREEKRHMPSVVEGGAK